MNQTPTNLTADHLRVIDPLERGETDVQGIVTAAHLPLLDALEAGDPIEPLKQGSRDDVVDLMEESGDGPSA